VGTTTTLIASSPQLVEKPYDCALVAVTEFNGGVPKEFDEVNFPISVPAPPNTPTTTSGGGTGPAIGTPSATPSAAPGLLSFLKSKPLMAKAGKWTTLKLKVANTGGTAVGPIAIKAKAPGGVVLRSKTVKLPALLPGQAWPVTIQFRLTAKAKKKSTITLTGASGSLIATGSAVLKLQR
jgi:hypothetical protein